MGHSLLVALLAAAVSQAKPPAQPGTWESGWRVKGTLEYNTNVWLLDGDHRDRLKNDLPADQASGRYDDMESVEDVLFIPEGRFELKGPSPLGRRLDAWADLKIPVYFLNPRRTHFDLGLGVGQSVGPDGHVGLSFGILPEYFNRNYLADAVDTSGDGDISSAERIYDEGVYREFDVRLEYRHVLVDRNAQQPLGLEGAVTAGYRMRTYDSPFQGRDQSALSARIVLDASYAFRNGAAKGNAAVLKGGVFYLYEASDSPTEQEVVLLDETFFGVDFSGDLDTADNNARSVQAVDRSTTAHRFGISLGAALGPDVDLGVEYSRLLKDYDSGNRLDVSHSGRDDTRDDFGLFAKFGLSKGWDLKLGYEWRRQFTNRPGDPDSAGETTDYKRNIYYVSLWVRF